MREHLGDVSQMQGMGLRRSLGMGGFRMLRGGEAGRGAGDVARGRIAGALCVVVRVLGE